MSASPALPPVQPDRVTPPNQGRKWVTRIGIGVAIAVALGAGIAVGAAANSKQSQLNTASAQISADRMRLGSLQG